MLEADLVLPTPDWYLDNVLLAGQRRPWDRYWDELERRLRSGGAAEQCAARQGFVLTRGQAREAGVDTAAQRRLVYADSWWAPRRGILAPFPRPVAAADSAAAEATAARHRHAITATAAALARPGQVISGRSAAVLRGLPTFAVPCVPEVGAGPELRPGRRRRAHLWAASLGVDEVTTWFGASVTTPARTVVDCARHDRFDGIMAADAALRDELVSRSDLDRAIAHASGWPFVRRARSIVKLADGRAESPLESITRLRIADGGLPVPDLQVWIRDPWTGRHYRVDGLWAEQRVVLEIDGTGKYTAAELRREAEREHALRRLGYRIVRLMWDDVVMHWARTVRWLERELDIRPDQPASRLV